MRHIFFLASKTTGRRFEPKTFHIIKMYSKFDGPDFDAKTDASNGASMYNYHVQLIDIPENPIFRKNLQLFEIENMRRYPYHFNDFLRKIRYTFLVLIFIVQCEML